MVWDARNPLVSFIVLVVLMWLGPLTACSNAVDATRDESQLQQFFVNAERREPASEESAAIVRLRGCTGFFVRNTKNQVLMMTARHCLGSKAADAADVWCASGVAVADTNSGALGTCKRVVAAEAGYDLTMFEMDFGNEFQPAATLRLAKTAPAIETQLVMIGYPSDKFRESQLTLTENCWVTGDVGESPYTDLLDPAGHHNCTTYGGNSGGPMIIRGTDIVIGEPFTYFKNSYTEYRADAKHQASYASTVAFVERHTDELKEAGVVLAE